MDIEWIRFYILNLNRFLSVETYWNTRVVFTTEIQSRPGSSYVFLVNKSVSGQCTHITIHCLEGEGRMVRYQHFSVVQHQPVCSFSIYNVQIDSENIILFPQTILQTNNPLLAHICTFIFVICLSITHHCVLQDATDKHIFLRFYNNSFKSK